MISHLPVLLDSSHFLEFSIPGRCLVDINASGEDSIEVVEIFRKSCSKDDADCELTKNVEIQGYLSLAINAHSRAIVDFLQNIKSQWGKYQRYGW